MMVQGTAGRPVCVVVVNWNGWSDTAICLRSLLAVTGHPVDIVVCDNNSTDESVRQLSHWLAIEVGGPSAEICLAAVEGHATVFMPRTASRATGVRCVHLLRLPRNFGYAGALNRGIVWGREKFSASSFWLLNNDVRVQPHALEQLVLTHDAVPDAGLCGSVLLSWDSADTIQAVAGMYCKTIAVGRHVRELPKLASSTPNVWLDADYPVGASLFVEQNYLDQVGPMDESYFLYYEEMDWVERGRRLGWRPVVALGSRLYHKEGASTGSHGGVRRMSLLSERYGIINRLRITRKFWPTYLPLVWLSLWAVLLNRLAHGEGARARLVLLVMFSPGLWLRV